MKKIVFAVAAFAIVSDANSFRIEDYYHKESKCHYTAYCFNKEEADKISTALKAGKAAADAVSLIPAASAVAGVIAKVIASVNFVVWWSSAKGKKGFSVNIPKPQGILEQGRTPFLWESEG